MPRLIWFMLNRFIAGFAIGCVTGILIWHIHIAAAGHAFSDPDSLLAEALFTYLFASTIGGGYMATALWLDEL